MNRPIRIAAAILALMLLAWSAFAALAEPQEQADNPLAETLYKLVSPYYEAAIEPAVKSPGFGRDFTDHKINHALMVVEKSAEAGEAIRIAVEKNALPTEALEGRVGFSADFSEQALEGAAIFHDTGMCGLGYAPMAITDDSGQPLTDINGHAVLQKDHQGLYMMAREDLNDFSTIRTYHSLNSGLFVLVSREELVQAGYTDLEVDMMAAACQAHSKSSSGVRDLNKRSDWSYAFDLIDGIVYAWNADHPDEQISFDRTPFEAEGGKVLSMLASMTLALRVGDVSRDSGPDAEVQTGETVHVDRSTLNNKGGTYEAELEGAVIVIGENAEPVESLKSRQVHAGEQNIPENHTYAGDDGTIYHEIVIADGCSAPRCTQMAINDHLGEFRSAYDGQFTVILRFLKFEDDDLSFFLDSWESYLQQCTQDYPNISVMMPEKEEAP